MRSVFKAIAALLALSAFVLFAPTSQAATPNGVAAGPWTWVNQASGWCLDQDYSGGQPHHTALAWGCDGGSNQLWYSIGQSDGANVVQNQASGWCLDQNYSGGQPHHDVLVWQCNGGANQEWITFVYGDGTFTFVNEASGWCLDQDYSGGQPHNTLLAWPCNGGANQHWR